MRNRWTATVAVLALTLTVGLCAASFAQESPASPIMLELNNVPIAVAIKQLLGQGYVIEAGVTGMVGHVDARFPNKEVALRALLKTIQGVTYRKDENGTYVISMKSSTATDVAPAPPVDSLPTATAEDTPKTTRVEKIKLVYADAADIAAFFGVESVGSRNNPFGGGGQYGGMGMMGGGMGMMGGGMGGGMGGSQYGGMGGGQYGGSMGGGSYGGGGLGGRSGGFGGGGMGGGSYGGYRGY